MYTNGPYLRAAILCDSVREDKGDESLSLINTVDTYSVSDKREGVPVEIPITAAFMFSSGEADGEYEVAMVLQDSDGEREDLYRKLVPMKPGQNQEVIIQNQTISLSGRGTHKILVSINKYPLTAVVFRVI